MTNYSTVDLMSDSCENCISLHSQECKFPDNVLQNAVSSFDKIKELRGAARAKKQPDSSLLYVLLHNTVLKMLTPVKEEGDQLHKLIK